MGKWGDDLAPVLDQVWTIELWARRRPENLHSLHAVGRVRSRKALLGSGAGADGLTIRTGRWRWRREDLVGRRLHLVTGAGAWWGPRGRFGVVRRRLEGNSLDAGAARRSRWRLGALDVFTVLRGLLVRAVPVVRRRFFLVTGRSLYFHRMERRSVG
jgi:hypothetical protein